MYPSHTRLHPCPKWRIEPVSASSPCVSSKFVRYIFNKEGEKKNHEPTGVNKRVFLHVGLLVEPFAAVLAGKGPGVRVYEQMCGQGGGALEHFAAHRTVKCPVLTQQTSGSYITSVNALGEVRLKINVLLTLTLQGDCAGSVLMHLITVDRGALLPRLLQVCVFKLDRHKNICSHRTNTELACVEVLQYNTRS